MGIVSRWLVRVELPLVLLLAAGAALAQEMTFPMVTGKEWKHSTKDEKLSFINGVTTVIELEKEVQGLAPGASGSSLVDGWVHGLASMRLDEIVCRLQARPASTCPLLNKGL